MREHELPEAMAPPSHIKVSNRSMPVKDERRTSATLTLERPEIEVIEP